MKNNKLVISIVGSVISLAGFILSLVYYIKSFYSGDYGTDGKEFSFDSYFICLMLTALILLVFFVYSLVKALKKEEAAKVDNAVYFSASTILSFYSLGVFLKAWTKALSKHKEFNYVDNQVYLYVGLVALIPAVYFAIKCVKQYKELNTSK